MQALIDKATTHIGDILLHAIEFSDAGKAVVIYDKDSPLAQVLTSAYQSNIPTGEFILFDESLQGDLLEKIESLDSGDLVILVQTTSFRLNEFRLRIELFKRGLKTIEHVHLGRFEGDQFERYVDTLAYDPAYYRPVGHALKSLVDDCKKITITCPGTTLVYDSAFETTRLNIGDYSQMNNVGGTFPIGEVFSEPTDLKKVNGEIKIFAFPGLDHVVREYEPFKATIHDGILSAPEAPSAFKEILDLIEQRSPVYVRELGLGLNPAMGKGQIINDVTAFERMRGVHLSLGSKHSIFKKPGFPSKAGGYHIDIFLDVDQVRIDDTLVFDNWRYSV